MNNFRYDYKAEYFLSPGQSVTVRDENLPQLDVEGKVGPKGLSKESLDLIDLGTFVYLLERKLPGKQQMNRLSQLTVKFGVRDESVWSQEVVKDLEDLLFFIGGTHWKFEFWSDKSLKNNPNPLREDKTASKVALFSGGLDSLCGASTLIDSPDVRLVSFYTRQKSLQRELAANLGMHNPVQWHWKKYPSVGRGRNFRYRSFLFLCLAAATAQSYDTNKIIQFENGILASSIAPSLSIQVTKHAHYRLHRLSEMIFSNVLGGQWNIDNPFRLTTKRGAYEKMEQKIGKEKANLNAAKTETCWNLYAGFKRKVYNVEEKKPNGVPCGFCVPCMIRQTAHPQSAWVDLRKDDARNDLVQGRYFREYYNMVQRILSVKNGTPGEFYKAMDTNLLDAIHPRGGYNLIELRDLFIKFSDEFMDTYF